MILPTINDRITASLDILEALYFFLQSVPENQERLNRIRQTFKLAPKHIRSGLLEELHNEVKWLRSESGAISSNKDFLDYFREAGTKGVKGHVLIPKWEIDRRWFRKFDRVIARWPFVKDHAMVIYDPQDGSVRNQMFELEGSLFRDAELLLEQARNFHRGVGDFRKRGREDQLMLHTYLHSGATVVFHYLEAYLNGLAFDCLLHYHNQLSEPDHDLLVEWDRKNQRRAFVNVEKKIFRYPLIFGKCANTNIDLSGCKPAHFLAKDAKEVRDALTHPSPHIDRETQTLKKVTLIASMDLPILESISAAAREYTLTVEKCLFGKPDQTAPWLFPKAEKPQTATPTANAPADL
jgi:hypothetical protein